MLPRFQDIGRIGLVGCFALLAGTWSCSNVDDVNTGKSAGGAGSPSGGMAAAGMPSSSGSATGGAGASAGGNTSGGVSTAGNATGGAAAGGTSAGGASAGSGGASAGSGGGGGSGGGAGGKSKTTFFVTSDKSMTGNLGGLDGADKRCQDLAKAAGFGDHTFHAYLSTATVNAKDRIGTGPWTNSKGLKVADSVATLHSAATKGDHTIFIDEMGNPIHGQWDGGPVEHDVLTGTMPDGTLQTGQTCMDWTSNAANLTAQVGHSDGMGPGMATTGTYSSWNSAHTNGSCMDTAPKGGAGRLYCFAID